MSSGKYHACTYYFLRVNTGCNKILYHELTAARTTEDELKKFKTIRCFQYIIAQQNLCTT